MAQQPPTEIVKVLDAFSVREILVAWQSGFVFIWFGQIRAIQGRYVLKFGMRDELSGWERSFDLPKVCM